MALWPFILLSLALSALLAAFLHGENRRRKSLPPGPSSFPVIGNLFWLRRSLRELEAVLRDVHTRYGPIVALRIGPFTAVFISDRVIAHKALVGLGVSFADRPSPPFPSFRVSNAGHHIISSAPYGPLWRVLRRNITAEILHPARVKLYAGGRAWVLRLLIDHLRAASGGGSPVVASESFQFAVFCLLVFMCFGEKLEEKAIREIERAQRTLLLYGAKLSVLDFAPAISRLVFRNRVKTALAMREIQRQLYLPLIESRRRYERRRQIGTNEEAEEEERFVYSYLDSLLNVDLPDNELGGRRKLCDDEIVTLCSEFLNGGTDTTATALEWIMANLVKRREVQEKLREEIDGVVPEGEEVKEEDLQRMEYLKAVIMEGLRRHPPGHFVLPHAVTEDVDLCGYRIPKGASINFLVAEMNWDRRAWPDPMAFRPERFLGGGEGVAVDITGSKEIKMMPFGAGRRICPGMGLAMLHLEYFVANLVRAFEWEAAEGEEVDLSEKVEFTVVMKNRLRARIIPRKKA
ncbi:cytochrome P450 89A2-like [Zingiber officinale]|uniref:Cytochrome P450 n=1 Tax=Zingiber officinale TaxID=94328 RepID=A0A8J5KMS7_ZINOF|nr:cytochrome P450 89A2-like [Zingiber officinale]KAG6482943.1 hypothetical protein ZIOFF_059582 [Zingiber officinale]